MMGDEITVAIENDGVSIGGVDDSGRPFQVTLENLDETYRVGAALAQAAFDAFLAESGAMHTPSPLVKFSDAHLVAGAADDGSLVIGLARGSTLLIQGEISDERAEQLIRIMREVLDTPRPMRYQPLKN